ncbi:MAG: 2OG-Fe(II) oxygenase [Pseudonocardiaceae bacterium]
MNVSALYEVSGSAFVELGVKSFDLTGLCPPGWQDAIATCCISSGVERRLDGSSLTSREPRSSGIWAPPVFSLVDGKDVAEQVPWLLDLYQHEILHLARENYGDVSCSTDSRAGVNINLQHSGSRYEWHVDSNPLTAVLFVTSHDSMDGGALAFRPDTGERVTAETADHELMIHPVSGTLIFFRAQRYAHQVTEFSSKYRIGVPMNFFISGIPQDRADVDEYLY